MNEKKSYKKLTIDDVYDFCQELGLVCKSKEYRTVKGLLTFVCTQCGEDFNRSFDNLRNRKVTVCNKCGKDNRARKQAFDIHYVRKFVEDESECKLISKTYVNTDSPLEFECYCGEKFTTSFYRFKDKDKRQCTPCGTEIIAQKLLTPIEEIRELVESVGYVLIERTHSSENKTHTITVECDKKHVYNVSYHKFRYGRRCPHCSSSLGETAVEEVLERYDTPFQIEYKFDDLVGIGGSKLRFDFGVLNTESELVYLIEYDGRQHFEPVEVMGGQEKFEITVKHDDLKNNYCYKNNIPLLRIPYWEFDSIEDIIKENIIENNKLEILKERSA